MATVSIIGQKGGTGKTTVALGLATIAAAKGLAVVVIDLDPQASALNWADRYNGENILVVQGVSSRLAKLVEQAHRADLILIDTPGKAESTATDAARLSDVVLIPVKPEVFDFETLPTMHNIIMAAGGKKSFVLLNAVHPSGHRQAEELKALIEAQYKLTACPIHLTTRAAHPVSHSIGTAPDGKAGEEMTELLEFVLSHAEKR